MTDVAVNTGIKSTLSIRGCPAFHTCVYELGEPQGRWFGSVTGLDVDPKPKPDQYLQTLLYQTNDGGETWNLC